MERRLIKSCTVRFSTCNCSDSRKMWWVCRNCEALVDLPAYIKQKYTLKKKRNKHFEETKKKQEKAG